MHTELVKGSKQHPYLLLTPQAPVDLLDHMAQRAEKITHQKEFVASLFLFLVPFKVVAF